MKIIIPARAGSKGLPGKNKTLFRYTANIIPDSYKNLVIVLTDDPEIHKMSSEYGFESVERLEETATDDASMKFTLNWAINYLIFKGKLTEGEDILLLYLTYPERTWSNIESAINFYNQKSASSLLCRKEIDFSPFLILKEEENDYGSQLFWHDLYRRQDYPKCFELSHFICIVNSSAINSLNNNLYNNQTVFFPIDNPVDVDTKKDLNKFYELSK
jgi:CMP-N,N'-diacetyllegionaminic acid synthase